MVLSRKVLVSFGVLVIIGVVTCFGSCLLQSDSIAEKYYVQGAEFLNAKDYQNAYYNFAKIRPSSKYYPLSLYRQATCATSLKDSKTAMQKYGMFVNKYPSSLFAPRSMYEYAKELYNQKKYKESYNVFVFIKQSFPNTDYAVAANYFIGLIIKSQAMLADVELNKGKTNADSYNQDLIKKSVAYWLEYVNACPDCTYSMAGLDEIISLYKTPSADTLANIGKVFYINKKYKQALEYLQKGRIAKSWNYLVLTNLKIGNKVEAKKIFDENVVKYGRSITVDELNEVASAYINSLDGSKFVNWNKVLRLAVQNQLPLEDIALYNLAILSKNKDEKIGYLKRILTQYPNSKYASEASWELFWIYCNNKEHQLAIEYGQQHLIYYRYSETEPAILYWMGKINLYKKDQSKANYYFEKLFKDYPDDYYAYRAATMYKSNNLNWHKNSNKKLAKSEFDSIVELPLQYTKWSKHDKELLKLAIEANDTGILDDVQVDNKIIQSWVMYKNQKYSSAASYARDWLKTQYPRPDFSQSPYQLAYPIFYVNEINKHSTNLQLDPFLIMGLIKEESYFNKDATSSVGAKGLMQIMPSTARFIAALKNVDYKSFSQLSSPDINIELGCHYFNFIKAELNNSNLLAVAAYNGGPNAVKGWINKKDYVDFDEFVENIPYSETKNYVKKVYKAYWNYLNVYSNI